MQVNVVFSIDNDAFHFVDGGIDNNEVAAVLRQAADLIEVDAVADQVIRLRDSNGARVGFAVINEDGIGATAPEFGSVQPAKRGS